MRLNFHSRCFLASLTHMRIRDTFSCFVLRTSGILLLAGSLACSNTSLKNPSDAASDGSSSPGGGTGGVLGSGGAPGSGGRPGSGGAIRLVAPVVLAEGQAPADRQVLAEGQEPADRQVLAEGQAPAGRQAPVGRQAPAAIRARTAAATHRPPRMLLLKSCAPMAHRPIALTLRW